MVPLLIEVRPVSHRRREVELLQGEHLEPVLHHALEPHPDLVQRLGPVLRPVRVLHRDQARHRAKVPHHDLEPHHGAVKHRDNPGPLRDITVSTNQYGIPENGM